MQNSDFTKLKRDITHFQIRPYFVENAVDLEANTLFLTLEQRERCVHLLSMLPKSSLEVVALMRAEVHLLFQSNPSDPTAEQEPETYLGSRAHSKCVLE